MYKGKCTNEQSKAFQVFDRLCSNLNNSQVCLKFSCGKSAKLILFPFFLFPLFPGEKVEENN